MQAASLSDMERTLVRNLTDHLGNNLVHVVARHGHAAQLLPWLATRLGPELEPALADENKRGLTPATLAIKVSSSFHADYSNQIDEEHSNYGIVKSNQIF